MKHLTQTTHVTHHQGASGKWSRRWFCQLDTCAAGGKWNAVSFGVWLCGFDSLEGLMFALNNRNDPTLILPATE